MNKIFLVITMGFLFFGLSSCEQKIFKKIKYDGYVFDSINGSPMSGISITLSACGTGNGDQNGTCNCHTFVIGSDVTGSDGSFHIEGKEPRNPIYFVWGPSATFNDRHRCVSESVLKGKFHILYLN